MISKEDRERVIKLIEGGGADDTVDTIVRRITELMPHVTVADIRELAAVREEETRMDIAEIDHRNWAYQQIQAVIKETEQISEKTGLTVNQTIALLKKRIRAGDLQAKKLLDKITKATTAVGGLEEPLRREDFRKGGYKPRR